MAQFQITIMNKTAMPNHNSFDKPRIFRYSIIDAATAILKPAFAPQPFIQGTASYSPKLKHTDVSLASKKLNNIKRNSFASISRNAQSFIASLIFLEVLVSGERFSSIIFSKIIVLLLKYQFEILSNIYITFKQFNLT